MCQRVDICYFKTIKGEAGSRAASNSKKYFLLSGKRDQIPFDAGSPNIEKIIKDNKLEQLFPILSDEGVGAQDIKIYISCGPGTGTSTDITIPKKYFKGDIFLTGRAVKVKEGGSLNKFLEKEGKKYGLIPVPLAGKGVWYLQKWWSQKWAQFNPKDPKYIPF